MVNFGKITSKRVQVEYTKTDVEGYKVVGEATYNQDGKLTEAFGSIRDSENVPIAYFNSYGEGEYARINLTDCIPAMMEEATTIAQATLADLAVTHPEE